MGPMFCCGEGPGGWGHHHHGDGCCWGDHHGATFPRRFATREEKVKRLKRYLEDLRAEAAAVEEELQRLGGA